MSESNFVSRSEFDDLKTELEATRELLHQLMKDKAIRDFERDLPFISAAVATFLGKNAIVRSVRRTREDDDPWRSHGRARLEASHQIPRMRGW